MSASAPVDLQLDWSTGTAIVAAEAVDGGYFATLGVTAALGRTIQPADDHDASRVAVLSEGLWRSRFAADPHVVGRTIKISGQPFAVVRSRRRIVQRSGGRAGHAPLGSAGNGSRSRLRAFVTRLVLSRDRRRLIVFGRLAPNATLDRASAELGAIAAGLDDAHPPRSGSRLASASERGWRAKSVTAVTEDDNILRRLGMMLVALVGLVLVVACTNLANLVLVRGTTRQRELAIRSALGATRSRLVLEQCAESLILAAAGAVAAYIVFEGLRVLTAVDFNLSLPGGERWTLEIRPVINAPALAVAVVSLLMSLLVFGLEPALQVTRSLDVRSALAAGAGVGAIRTGRQRMLIRWQVAISAGFFVIATMFVKFTIAEARHDPGIDLERIGVAVVNLRSAAWDETRVNRAIERVLAEGRRDGSVEALAVSTSLPFGVENVTRLPFAVPPHD